MFGPASIRFQSILSGRTEITLSCAPLVFITGQNKFPRNAATEMGYLLDSWLPYGCRILIFWNGDPFKLAKIFETKNSPRQEIHTRDALVYVVGFSTKFTGKITEKKKGNFPITGGRRISSSAFLSRRCCSDTISPYQAMVPYLQPNFQAIVDLKLSLQSHMLNVTKIRQLAVTLVLLFSAECLVFWHDHTTKLGMKDLLMAQKWWVERDSNLIPSQYRLNALTTTSCPFSSRTQVRFKSMSRWSKAPMEERTNCFSFKASSISC